jgi:hypothetical protein
MNPQKRIAHARWLLTTLLLCHAILLRAQQSSDSFQKVSFKVVVLVESVPDSLLPFIKSVKSTSFNCKSPAFVELTIVGTIHEPMIVIERNPVIDLPESVAPKEPALSIVGDLSYRYQFSESPSNDYAFSNSTMHQVGVNLLVTHKGKPYRLNMRYNHVTPFQIDDLFELSIGFDKERFEQNLLEKMSRQLLQKAQAYEATLLAKLDSMRLQMQSYQDQTFTARNEVSDASLRDFVRSGNLYEPKTALPSLPEVKLSDKIADPKIPDTDSLVSKFPTAKLLKDTATINRMLTGGKATIHKVKSQRDSLLRKYDSLRQLVTKINQLRLALSPEQLKNSLNKQSLKLAEAKALKQLIGEKDSLLETAGKPTFSLPDLRLGRYILNHSDLTINNVYLKGVTATIKGEKTLTFSVGLMDFAFNNFVAANVSQLPASQFITAAKYSWQRNQVKTAWNIFYGFKRNPQAINEASNYPVYGLSLEKDYKINKQLQVGFEAARSIGLEPNTTNPQKATNLLAINNTDNYGFLGKASYNHLRTATQLDAELRFIGTGFENFNPSQLFNPGNAYKLRLRQYFVKKYVELGAQVQGLDFSKAYIGNNVNAKTTFYSLNTTIRLPKLPVLMVGYYPGTQTFLNNNNTLYQYHYYLLTGSLMHQLRLGTNSMNIMTNYTKIKNSFSDSATVVSNYSYSGGIGFNSRAFGLNGGYTYQQWDLGALQTVEAGGSYTANKWSVRITLRQGFRQNQTYFGYAVFGSANLGELGTVMLSVDRGFFPDRSGNFQNLYSGQLHYVKPINWAF